MTLQAPASLTIPQAAALLESTVSTLRSEAEALGQEAMRWHPAEAEWCFNEVIGHLIEAEERGFAGRIRDIIEGRPVRNWDQEEVAKERHDCEKSCVTLLSEFHSARADGVRLVRSLKTDQFSRSAEHPVVGELRVVDLLHEWQYHDRAHVSQAIEIVRAYVWPHMGNAQRF